MYYDSLVGADGIDILMHGTTLYNSIYIGDDAMIVNTHRYGINAYATPVLQLSRTAEAGLFDGYAESFEQVMHASRPVREN
jgi:hypothetical protein